MRNKYGQTKADRKAMLADAADRGRILLKKHGLTAGDVSSMFAAIVPAQRQIIMEHYLKNGVERP